jgi:thiopurine S-methyltransferase
VEAQFWQNRWRNGQIGFHQSSVDGKLRRHWPELPLRKGGRVFVPLCGKSLDLLWLRDQGHVVMGVELSARALEDFCRENGVPARRRIQTDFDVYEAGNLELYRGDFFKLTPSLVGEAAAVYDRAALISWAPELRSAYVDHLTAIVRPGAQMLLITLEYPQAQMSGPPFSVHRDEMERLYSKSFEIRELSRQDILAQEDRLRSLGVTSLFEVCYYLVRH